MGSGYPGQLYPAQYAAGAVVFFLLGAIARARLESTLPIYAITGRRYVVANGPARYTVEQT